MLAASTLAQGAAAVTIHGPAFLIPVLRDEGLSLPQAGLVAAAPTIGVMLTLVAWGLLTDRRGERFVLVTGLALTAVAGLVAMAVRGPVALFVALLVAGAAAASTGSASGRVVVGWFPPHRRGLAMGVRQMAQPTGVAVAAVSIAVVAESYGVATALGVPVAVAAAAAGSLVAGAQLAGALGRIAAGQLSDVVASRLRPLRWVAVAAGATMVALGLAAGQDAAVAVPLVVLATVLTVADNGLAFTAVAERAGPHWSGRALGAQNTAQYLTASAVPPLAGLLVDRAGYAAAFALAGLFPLLAVGLVPVRDEHDLG